MERDTRSAASSSSCVDDASYYSALGWSCAQHEALNCKDLGYLGVSIDQVRALLDHCPVSCGVSSCLDNVNHNRLNAQSDNHVTRIEETMPGQRVGNRRKRARLVKDDWDSSCQDDRSYMSPIGLGCDGFLLLDCRVFSTVGFNENQVFELIKSCPRACGIECGTWTAAPTLHPTISPTVSPSSNPTKMPSRVPSSTPTSKPSTSPSISPTAVFSSVPSSLPSALPTVTGSDSPSSAPSLSPSNSPSARYAF